ncbi:FUSC family protein [Ancylobacter terrae]|uniref:FUSC family protein n=1 Tax=Ancylobacter sp. sgz301288 TaxID=3342077 RepID=UPI0038597D95
MSTQPLAHSAPAEGPPWWARLRADLAPFPGRLALTWRIALLCALVSATAMLYQTPEAAISCYLVIFLMKPSAVENIGTAVGLIALVAVVVALMIPLINATADSPGLRLLAIALVSFAFLFLGAASQLGETGGVIALVVAFLLTLVSLAPVADALSFGLRYAAYMAMMPMAWMIGFNLVLGLSPVRLLRMSLLQRLEASAQTLDGGPRAPLDELLRAGNDAAEKQSGFVRLLNLLARGDAAQVGRDGRAGYRLMLAVAALPPDVPTEHRATLAAAIRAAREALCANRSPPRPIGPPPDASAAERAAWDSLAIMAGGPEGPVTPAPSPPFLAPDAFRNPDYVRFALKTTAAAVVCYIIYSGLDWQGIHTAMITCYVAALGTTGETVHKLGLRIGGCLIGAAMGMASILFVMPRLESIGGLMALVFAGVLIGAWVSTGPERIAYGGVQIALAFLLTVLQGFGPTTSLDTAWDRIVGILLGNLVVYVIFTRIWPVSIESAARGHLLTAIDGLARLSDVPRDGRGGTIAQAAQVEAEIGKAGELLELIPFEPRSIRPDVETQSALLSARRDMTTLNRDLALGRENGDVQARLTELRAKVAA